MVQAEVQKSSGKIDKMVKLCLQEQDEYAEGACQGFVLGVVTATRQYAALKQISPSFCISRDIDINELVAVYRLYLNQVPARSSFPAAMLAITAFGERYPCQQKAAP
jgi:hypothetical protein